jgi:phospholipid/cholesterol/gamma-HCH transport system substrate-binding protein
VTRAIKKHLGDFIALLVLFLIAIGVSGYIIANQDARPFLPLVESKPFTIKAEFSDAQAVTPGQGQSVRVAGVQVGKITKVDLKNGIAVVTMELEAKWKDKLDIRGDASGLLRPRTGLKDMFVELDPGVDPKAPLLKSGDTIPVQNTAPDIDPDEILSAFDTDTRTYLQLLINSAGKGLKGRGNDLNQVFKRLEPTNRDLARVTSAIAERRKDLKELIHRYGDLTNALATKDKEIKTLVSASDAVFKAFAVQRENIASAISKLPPTLRQTETTLAKADAFSRVLQPTLEDLRPAFRQLAVANQQVLPFVREAYPITRDEIRPFVRYARPYVKNLRPAAVNLARATPDLTKSFHQLNRFFNMFSYNPNGAEPVSGNTAQDKARQEGYLYWLGWTVQNTVSLFSTSDANGPFRRALAGFDCATLRQQLAANPASGPLLGLSNPLNDVGLCGGSNSGLLDALPPVNLPPLPKGHKKGSQQTGAPTPGKPSTDGGSPTGPLQTPAIPQTPATPETPPLPGLPLVSGTALGGGN